jgi:hypothetical protein
MWGWLVRMTKEDGRGGQWPSPEATQCFSLHRAAREWMRCALLRCVYSSNPPIPRVFFLIFSLSGLTRECVPTLPGDFLRPQLTVE